MIVLALTWLPGYCRSSFRYETRTNHCPKSKPIIRREYILYRKVWMHICKAVNLIDLGMCFVCILTQNPSLKGICNSNTTLIISILGQTRSHTLECVFLTITATWKLDWWEERQCKLTEIYGYIRSCRFPCGVNRTQPWKLGLDVVLNLGLIFYANVIIVDLANSPLSFEVLY